MSAIVREKSKIQFYDDETLWEESRFKDIVYDLIDDNHVRINKIFPLCNYDADQIMPSDYRRFHLRVYLPQSVYNDKYKKIKKCFVCFNGLDELDHFTLYDQIGKGLASNGYGMILLPLPDHLNRNPQYRFNTKKKKIKPSRAFISEPKNIYEAYLQNINEVKVLVSHIRGRCELHKSKQCCAFFRRFFDPETRISLIGYSLGGLVALSNFLVLEDDKLVSCTLLNSGAKLRDIDVSEFVSKDEWLKMVKNVQKQQFDLPKTDNASLIFNMIFLGNQRELFQEKLQEKSSKILFILGGADSVTNFDSILDMEPENHGLSILKLPGIHHFLSIDTHWDRWFPIVNNTIYGFEESAAKSSLWPNDILWSLLKFQMKYKIFDNRTGSVDLTKIPDSDEQDVLARTIFTAEATYSNLCEVMIEMYILLHRAQKKPQLYPDIKGENFNNFFGVVVTKLFNSDFRLVRDFLNLQKIMAKESGEIIPLRDLYLAHKILTKEQIAKALAQIH